jgi:IclR family transcriptional regulator, KDG regulon repressor
MDKTFLKGLMLLETLAQSEKPRGVTELSQEMGLTKSNVHRTLATLVSRGYVRKDPVLGRYEMTIRLWEVASKILNRLSLKPAASPFMQHLAAHTHETVHLSILDGLDVVYIDKIDSPEPVRAYSVIGGRSPAYCVATGKAMLAFQSPEFLAEIPFAGLPRFTERTVTQKDVFLREMERIRQNGYSVNRGEWRATVRGIAAPIFGVEGQVVGAVGLSGPGDRFNENKLRQYAPRILEAGEGISRAFGYTHAAYPPALVGK